MLGSEPREGHGKNVTWICPAGLVTHATRHTPHATRKAGTACGPPPPGPRTPLWGAAHTTAKIQPSLSGRAGV